MEVAAFLKMRSAWRSGIEVLVDMSCAEASGLAGGVSACRLWQSGGRCRPVFEMLAAVLAPRCVDGALGSGARKRSFKAASCDLKYRPWLRSGGETYARAVWEIGKRIVDLPVRKPLSRSVNVS